MERRGWQASRMVAAVFAAYVLVLQGLFGAVASSQHAAGMAIDRAIQLSHCDPNSEGSPTPAGQDHAKLPACCTQGCALGVAIGSVPPAIAALVAYETFSIIGRAPQAAVHPAAPVDASTGRPRAPPTHLRTI